MSEMLLLDRRTQRIVEESVPQADILEELVSFFSVFADATRLKIIFALSISELCVTDLAKILHMNQTTISHQLRSLKANRVVKIERHGRIVFYSISNAMVNDVLLHGVEFLGY